MLKRLTLFVLLLLGYITLFAQVKVTFVTGKIPLAETSAQKIFLAGNFNNWNPNDTAWQLKPGESTGLSVVKLLPKGKYNFKATKGSWNAVETIEGVADRENREVIINQDTVIIINIADWKDIHPMTLKKHTASTNVHMISENFDMPQLGRKRRV